jgi:hypothetical protein
VIATNLVFVVMLVLYGVGVVGRGASVLWEWLTFFSSMVWLVGHTVVLGREHRGVAARQGQTV